MPARTTLPRPDPASAAQRQFDAAARAVGMDPADRWVGGYADYEWNHLRPVLAAYAIAVTGARVLELGCNIGASAVVLAALGAEVTGVDIDARAVAVADANLARHRLAGRALPVADTRTLPFPDATFDFALANSVLEYVAPEQLDGVIAELHRVLRPGGRLLICGTSSRIAPREQHSGRWLVNYRPRALDRMLGMPQRGLGPIALARACAGRFRVVKADAWIAARGAVHGRAGAAKRTLAMLAGAIGIAPGWLSPSLELVLERR